MQRIWRLIGEIAERTGDRAGDRPAEFGEIALTLRKAAHRALAATGTDIERLAFNRCVAHIYTLANAVSKTLDIAAESAELPADMAAALHESATILVQLLAPMMPHLAEECWAVLGQPGLVGAASWPDTEAVLLLDDTVTLPIQINGKKRADVTVPADADAAAVEAAVRDLDSVRRALDGRTIRKIIVVPRRIVNVVA